MKIIGRFFSDKKEDKSYLKSSAVGGGIIGSAYLGNKVLENNFLKFKNNQDKKLTEKILAEARKFNPNLKVSSASGGDVLESYYEEMIKHGNPSEKKIGEFYKKYYLPLVKNDYKYPSYITSDDIPSDVISKYKGNTILASGYQNVPSVMAHEAGHAHYLSGNGSGIGKLAHDRDLRNAFDYLSNPVTASIAGILSGRNAALKELKGEKQNKLARHAPWLIPAIAAIPGLAAEVAANKQGINFLKSAGASKATQKIVQKQLLNNLGSYLTSTAIDSGVGELSRGLSKAYFKHKYNKNNGNIQD